jgi:predicted membrane protein
LILANNFGIGNHFIQTYIFRLQVILIFLGIINISRRDNFTVGAILIAIGGVFYLRDFFHLSFTFWQVFWPSLLILAGVLIIFRHKLDFDRDSGRNSNSYANPDDYIDEIAVFGGGDRVITSQQFKGGKVTAVFGGLNYNMLPAKLAPGENYIDVFCLFGGMKLIVPENWTVRIQVFSIFGGFGGQHRFKTTVANPDNSAQLIIKGTAIFGGGDIKSHFD